MIKVSVVLPVYKVEPYIYKCLDSLMNQTLKEIEIIAVDDGSPDNCGAILDEYAAGDSRICCIHKKNAGVSAARNDGLALTQGEYIFFADSDDWLEFDALEVMYSEAERVKADVVISDFKESDGENGLLRKVFSQSFVTERKETIEVIQHMVFPKGIAALNAHEFTRGYCLGAPWHHLIKSKLIKENGLNFDCYLKGMFDDGIFMLNVFQFASKISYIQKPTYNYRVVAGSITHRFNQNILDTYTRVFEKVEAFAKQYEKNNDFYKAYYIRVFAYLNKSMEVYFFHPENKASEQERYREFKTLVTNEPYRTATACIKLGNIGMQKSRFLAILLKLRMYRAYWQVKKVKYYSRKAKL